MLSNIDLYISNFKNPGHYRVSGSISLTQFQPWLIVLNNRDRYENVWLLKNMYIEKQVDVLPCTKQVLCKLKGQCCTIKPFKFL